MLKLVKEGDKQFLVSADVKVAADPNSLMNTLDQLDKLNVDAWVTLAKAYDLPVEPLEKKFLKPVLMGFIQNAWYAGFKNEVPEKCATGQENRVRKYQLELEELKKNPGKPPAAGKEKTTSAPRVSKSYKLVEGQREVWNKFRGQKELIVQAMEKIGSGTCATIAAMVKDKLETKQPPERVVAFYMNEWGHKGIVAAVGEEPSAAAPPPAVEEPKTPAAEPATPPKEEAPKKGKAAAKK